MTTTLFFICNTRSWRWTYIVNIAYKLAMSSWWTWDEKKKHLQVKVLPNSETRTSKHTMVAICTRCRVRCIYLRSNWVKWIKSGNYVAPNYRASYSATIISIVLIFKRQNVEMHAVYYRIQENIQKDCGSTTSIRCYYIYRLYTCTLIRRMGI